MKSTETDLEQFGTIFNDDNTLIANMGVDWYKTIEPELAKLNSEGKTVVITDPYLFNSNHNNSYITDVIKLLKSLRAKKIIYANSKSIYDMEMENTVIEELINKVANMNGKNLKFMIDIGYVWRMIRL